MKTLLLSITSLLLTLVASATVATVNCTISGRTTTTTKTSGNLRVENGVERGYAVWDLSSAGIPASATISSVKVIFVHTVSGTGTPTCRIYGYNGDISTLSAGSLYSGAVTANTLYTASWGTTSTTKTMTSTAAAVSFLQSFHTGTISLTWVLSGGSRIYSITGATSPQLQITYTCTTPTAVASASPVNVCNGSTLTLSGTSSGGTTYSWAGPNGYTSTSRTPASFTATMPATGVYTFTATSACGISTQDTVAVRVRNIPSPISGSATVCLGGTTTLTDTAGFGTWSASNSRATVTSGGVVTGVTVGTVNISYTTGCGTAVAKAMNVRTTPAAITGTTTVCTGSTTTLSNATAGGSWSSSNVGVATINSSGVVTGVSVGTSTITYDNNGCGIATTTVTDAPPAGTISGASTLCNGTSTTLTTTGSGGTWSSSNTGRATVTSGGVVTGTGTGAVTISYTTGCGSPATFAMTISSAPGAISGATFVCNGGTTALSCSPAGGTWSSSDNALATVNSSTGTVTGVSLGSINITYSRAGCSSTKPLTVNTTPASITGTNSICNGTTTTLANTTANGTWSSSNGSIATVNSTSGVVTGVSAGSATISYSTGCGSVATTTATIFSAPAAITGTTTVCQSSNSTLSNTNGGGTWSSSDNSIATIHPTTGVMTGVAQGSATITYAISSCLTTTSATINAVPASITGVTSICLPTTSDLDNTANAGTWTSSNAAIATVNSSTGVVTSVAVGTANITYSNGCGSAAVSAVNVGTTPAAITGTTTFCSNDNTTLSNAVAGGTWSSSNTSIATISAGGVVTGLAEGASTISYTMVNGCGTNAATTTVNVQLTGKWLGITSEWTDTDNWPCGTIPSASINVTIPAGTAYLPDFSGSTFEMKNLTVASGVSLTINSDATFNVKGNLINNGSILGDGTLNMVGTSAQTISGVGTVANVNIDNTNGVSVNTSDTMKISKVFTMSAGTFNANGGLLLLSNETGSARIAQIAGGSITGNVGVQQFFTGGRRAYRFFGHPFSAAIPLSQLIAGIDITGNGGAANGFTTTGSNAASCFRYNTLLGNTSLSSDPGWKPFTGTSLAIDTNQFKQYQGIRLFIRGTKGEGLGYGAYTPSDAKVTMYGPVNQGTQSINLRKTATSDYNQISNPFASPTNIGAAIATAQSGGQIAGSAFYVWNPFLGTAGAFQAVPISGSNYVIGANTSFQVRAAADNATLTINEAHKAATPNTNLLRTSNEVVTLSIMDANYHLYDNLYVNFDENASAINDNKLDATKAINPDLNFYTLASDNTKLTIDARPYEAGKSIAIGINSNYAQEFIIKANTLSIPQGGQVYLQDNFLGTTTLLSEGTEYRFQVTEQEASQGTKRFALKMGGNTTTTANNFNVALTPNPATTQVTVAISNNEAVNTNINITNIAGVSVASQDLGIQTTGTATFSLENLAAGIYMVEVTCGNNKSVQRLIKQ